MGKLWAAFIVLLMVLLGECPRVFGPILPYDATIWDLASSIRVEGPAAAVQLNFLH